VLFNLISAQVHVVPFESESFSSGKKFYWKKYSQLRKLQQVDVAVSKLKAMQRIFEKLGKRAHE
jgi:hypothetical protein